MITQHPPTTKINAVNFGYDKARFPSFNGDTFDCLICSEVARNPYECSSCGHLFCEFCIQDWFKRQKECPNRCPKSATINKITKALLKLYNDLDIKCQNYEDCKTVVKIDALDAHEKQCSQPKCQNFDVCQKRVAPGLEKFKVCDPACILLSRLKHMLPPNWVEYRKEIQNFLQEVDSLGGGGADVKGQAAAGNPGTSASFRWDPNLIGTNIELDASRTVVRLKEQPYMFRTVIGDTPLNGGLHYWEIWADPQTENELKIGVTTKRDFNINSAFCDYDHGFGYYGLGQLRHGSNASGSQYGKKFKKEGVLGIFLNMNRGELSFSLNGENMGVAFKSDELTKGPIWPAVSLLHCAGFTLVNTVPIPEIFMR